MCGRLRPVTQSSEVQTENIVMFQRRLRVARPAASVDHRGSGQHAAVARGSRGPLRGSGRQHAKLLVAGSAYVDGARHEQLRVAGMAFEWRLLCLTFTTCRTKRSPGVEHFP